MQVRNLKPEVSLAFYLMIAGWVNPNDNYETRSITHLLNHLLVHLKKTFASRMNMDFGYNKLHK